MVGRRCLWMGRQRFTRWGLIGSCTNSSYEDLTRAASIAKQAIEKKLTTKSDKLKKYLVDKKIIKTLIILYEIYHNIYIFIYKYVRVYIYIYTYICAWPYFVHTYIYVCI